MRKVLKTAICLTALLAGVQVAGVQVYAADLTDKQRLGKRLFFDQGLSEPAGQSCGSCHLPRAGFADPNRNIPVSEGVIAGRFGNRNTPSAAYASFTPGFTDLAIGAIGGQFWDGRAPNLTEQAKGPFLNAVEMNNTSEAQVVTKVENAAYARLFESVYGPNAFANIDVAYNNIADAIAAYENSHELNPFASKFDRVQQGLETFTAQEQQGLDLFTGRARCSICHTIDSRTVVFSDHRYHNIGLPKNREFPMGNNPVDLGLGAITNSQADNGRFKTPTLRNISVTAPYMHNGVLKTLSDVVSFYNIRDSGAFGQPEVANNINNVIGDLQLTADEEVAIVAFLRSLRDEP